MSFSHTEDARVLVLGALPADEPTLWRMLTYAASMGDGGDAEVGKAQADPYLRTYVEGWGRSGDLGVIARADGADVGAAWLREGDGAGSPFKLGEPGWPELATAVAPGCRGRGIGGLMMRRLIQLAPGRFLGIVLSVREGNPAERFYAQLGFREERRIENRAGGRSLKMRLAFPATKDG